MFLKYFCAFLTENIFRHHRGFKILSHRRNKRPSSGVRSSLRLITSLLSIISAKDQTISFQFASSVHGVLHYYVPFSGCSPESGDPIIEPLIVFDDLHKDCVNGVSLHPHKKLLATSSGQRYVSPPPLLDEDDDEEIKTDPIKTIDFSLKIWSFDATK